MATATATPVQPGQPANSAAPGTEENNGEVKRSINRRPWVEALAKEGSEGGYKDENKVLTAVPPEYEQGQLNFSITSKDFQNLRGDYFEDECILLEWEAKMHEKHARDIRANVVELRKIGDSKSRKAFSEAQKLATALQAQLESLRAAGVDVSGIGG